MLIPIGRVRSVQGDISEIEVFPEFTEGLSGIELLKELDIIFFFDRSEGYELLVHPRGDQEIPLVGVFGTRSPRRPNPLGLTRVRLLEVSGALLQVQGLDALPGTPIIDIKGVTGKDFSWSDLKGRSSARRPFVPGTHK